MLFGKFDERIVRIDEGFNDQRAPVVQGSSPHNASCALLPAPTTFFREHLIRVTGFWIQLVLPSNTGVVSRVVSSFAIFDTFMSLI